MFLKIYLLITELITLLILLIGKMNWKNFPIVCKNLDAAANELLDGICLFCSTQELRYLTDAELIETIYAQ